MVADVSADFASRTISTIKEWEFWRRLGTTVGKPGRSGAPAQSALNLKRRGVQPADMGIATSCLPREVCTGRSSGQSLFRERRFASHGDIESS